MARSFWATETELWGRIGLIVALPEETFTTCTPPGTAATPPGVYPSSFSSFLIAASAARSSAPDVAVAVEAPCLDDPPQPASPTASIATTMPVRTPPNTRCCFEGNFSGWLTQRSYRHD